MSPVIKQSFHWLGSILAIAGIVFVAIRLYGYSSQLDLTLFDSFTGSIIIGFVLVYCLANIVLAIAWWNLLIYFGVTRSRLWAIRIYGLTQLAKYVPGNIMHLASRQALGLAAGVKNWPLAKASIWELGLISIVGSFFAILPLPLFFQAFTIPVASVSFVCTLLVVMAVLNRYVSLNITRAFGWYVVFLTIAGLLFVGLLELFTVKNSISASQLLPYCGAFVVAWLAGFITPGAPAGIGVREVVLMVLLKGLVDEADLLVAVLMSRVVTVAGDVLFFLLSLFKAPKKIRF
jgi:uncharacterized membrane protein YbhN (UPF0104 family)